MRPALLVATRVAALVTIAVVILLLLLIPAHPHDWMQEVDPTLGPGDIEEGSSSGRIAGGLIAVVGLLAALLAGVTTGGRLARWLAVGGGVLVAATWIAKFANT